jgi:hypothetical protein
VCTESTTRRLTAPTPTQLAQSCSPRRTTPHVSAHTRPHHCYPRSVTVWGRSYRVVPSRSSQTRHLSTMACFHVQTPESTSTDTASQPTDPATDTSSDAVDQPSAELSTEDLQAWHDACAEALTLTPRGSEISSVLTVRDPSAPLSVTSRRLPGDTRVSGQATTPCRVPHRIGTPRPDREAA